MSKPQGNEGIGTARGPRGNRAVAILSSVIALPVKRGFWSDSLPRSTSTCPNISGDAAVPRNFESKQRNNLRPQTDSRSEAPDRSACPARSTRQGNSARRIIEPDPRSDEGVPFISSRSIVATELTTVSSVNFISAFKAWSERAMMSHGHSETLAGFHVADHQSGFQRPSYGWIAARAANRGCLSG